MGNIWTFSKVFAIQGVSGNIDTGNAYYSTGNYNSGVAEDYLGYGTGNYSQIPKQGHIVGAFGCPCDANGKYQQNSGNWWWSLEDEKNHIVFETAAFASGASFIYSSTDIPVWYGAKTKPILHVDTGGACQYYFIRAIITDC